MEYSINAPLLYQQQVTVVTLQFVFIMIVVKI